MTTARTTTLAEAIRNGRLLLSDGSMGTQLQSAGLPLGTPGELWNAERPEAVETIQARYREAGSDLLITNTFGGTRMRLKEAGEEFGDRVAELNRASVEVARRAMGGAGWVVGDIGPFGGWLEPVGDADQEEVYATYLEQARALVEAGVDALIVETQTAPEDLELALRAAREAGPPLLIASASFDHQPSGPPRTCAGAFIEQMLETMLEGGADVVGSNCGANMTSEDWTTVVKTMRAATDRPIIAQPNAGAPRLSGGSAVYDETPEHFAERTARLVDAGAQFVGGCCGTDARHIRALRELLDAKRG